MILDTFAFGNSLKKSRYESELHLRKSIADTNYDLVSKSFLFKMKGGVFFFFGRVKGSWTLG
jgi:hypothetical protein